MSGQRVSGMSPGRRGFGTPPPEIRPAAADREVVRALYHEAGPAAYGLALRILRRRGSAEEVVREGFQRIAASPWIAEGNGHAPAGAARHDLATPWGRSAFVANRPRTDLGGHPDRAGGFDHEDRPGNADRRDDSSRWDHSTGRDHAGGLDRSGGFGNSNGFDRSDLLGHSDGTPRSGRRGHAGDHSEGYDHRGRLDDSGRLDYAALHDPRLGFARRDSEMDPHSRTGRTAHTGRGDHAGGLDDSGQSGDAIMFDGVGSMHGAGPLAGRLDFAGHPDGAPFDVTDPPHFDTPDATGTRYTPTLHTRLLAQVHRLAIQRLRLDRNDRIDIPWLAASARLGFDPLDSRCEVFVLAYYGGRTYRSIARELGMRVPAVTRLLAEGIERLAHQRLVRVAARRPWTPPGSVLALADAYALDAVAELEHHHIQNKLATTTTTGLAQFDARVGGVHELLAQLAADDRQPPPRNLEQRILAAIDSPGRRGARTGRPPWLPRFGS
ncbi:RskA family anti-sigma factor [Nocardia ignorata]|uniref:Anti-sigma-K factor RskA N-terminal domain-containing protein n=1 Tax=Nocardia ignorata TaxID=145285 RepID=A0A4R6PS46_NOCIG|nr:hypothetical protein [Nocardia ignorata]TDP41538.1 hypothetical protein DFR75_101641 [Nocardia ignorata]